MKAKRWLEGRRSLFKDLEKVVAEQQNIIWIHSASAGEFEQAKPVIEVLKRQYPQYKIFVSIFSPSGYSPASKFTLVDYVFYLPLDTRNDAQKLVNLLQPQLVIFVKYDYWYYHLKAINNKNIPLLLVSSIFRQHQTFFKWYGEFYRRMLFFFMHIFVQDQVSLKNLEGIKVHHASIAGDTRFDRVLRIANDFADVKYISEFVNNQQVFIAGSTWPDDEKAIKYIASNFPLVKFIIAPHEINKDHIKELQKSFPGSLLYSQCGEVEKIQGYNVLIIDNVGMLSKLYKYATITYIGGGFNKAGIHNTLEAAVFGKPVLFGPNYQKFREAVDLINLGGAFSFSTLNELQSLVHQLLNDEQTNKQATQAAKQYVEQESGATQKILGYIQENRLLTN